MQLVATCLFGLEKQLGEEIDALGLKRIETIDGRVIFEGEARDIARANINLRLAERVFILMVALVSYFCHRNSALHYVFALVAYQKSYSSTCCYAKYLFNNLLDNYML